MSAGNNFVDLRMANAGIAGDSEDSVWPAFTDIMTVVLMIFLMSLVAFLIRNTQLVDELQTTLIEKDQISQKAFLSAEQNTALLTQLALVRERILSLQSSLQTVIGTKDQLKQTLEQREQAVRDLETEIALLTRLRDQLSNSNSDLFKQLDLNSLALAQTEQTLGKTQKSLTQTEQTLDKTQLTLTLTKLDLAEMQSEYTKNRNTLNEKISLLLAAKAGLIVAKEKGVQALSESEKARLELNRQVITLSEQLRMIDEKIDRQTSKNENLTTRLEDQKVIMAGLSIGKEELEQKLKEMADNLSKLRELYEIRGLVVSDLRASITTGQLEFKSLQEEYDSLDEQFRELIRPARSPAGKYVVQVYFSKQKGVTAYPINEPPQGETRITTVGELVAQQERQNIYRIREPEQDSPQVVSLSELHSRLAELKTEHKQALYTKIIIADNSGIEFFDAWRFTKNILSKYDYYSSDYSDTEPDSAGE
jgi:hypothetical protein